MSIRLHSTSHSKRPNHHLLFTCVLSALFAVGTVGCNQTNEQNVARQADTSQQTAQTAENTSQTKPQGTPVSYDIENWKKGKINSYKITDLKKIQTSFGKITSTDKNSLDYVSNAATKYRFMSDNKPYLDIIDSADYLELGWYYANPNDTDAEKKTSISHAKKVYALARNLMGEEGGELVGNMLTGQVIKNKTVGGQQVELAKCEFYSCMLILKKPNRFE